MKAAGTKAKTIPSRAKFLPSGGSNSFPRQLLILGLLLALASAALYFPVTHHPFVNNYDDTDYVTENTHVRQGLSRDTLAWAFTTFDQANWHPLTWLSHALDYQLFGSSSGAHHLTNLLLQVANVLLLFWVLWRATGFAGRSATVAALFALHPINVESVAWVAERKNLLSMAFFLLALGAYRWYASRQALGRYLAVAGLYAMGLMAKPQIVTFPFVLLLWDYWPLGRMFAKSPSADPVELPAKTFSFLVLEKVPLFALSAISAVVTMVAQRIGGGMNPDLLLPARLANAVVSYLRYIAKAFWPVRLAPMYPLPGNPLPSWQVWLALLALLAMTALVFAGRRHRYLVTGWLWFLGTLVPMIGVVQVGRQAMADRYAYLPFLGLFIVVCWALADFLAARRVSAAWQVILASTILLVLAVVSHRQLEYWNDNTVLWSHTIQVTTGNYVAENNLGDALQTQGEQMQALQHFYRSAEINPKFPETHMYIGRYEQLRGNPAAAIEQYEQVISLTQNAIFQNGRLRDAAFTNMGHAYRQLGELAKAKENLQAAVDLDSKNVTAWMELGLVAQKTGDYELAVRAYTQAMKIRPNDVGYLLLARSLEQAGRQAEAQAATQRARVLSRNFNETQMTAERLMAR